MPTTNTHLTLKSTKTRNYHFGSLVSCSSLFSKVRCLAYSSLIFLYPLGADQTILAHMKAMNFSFHLPYGSLLSSKGLHSDRPKCCSMVPEAGTPQTHANLFCLNLAARLQHSCTSKWCTRDLEIFVTSLPRLFCLGSAQLLFAYHFWAPRARKYYILPIGCVNVR